jgi:hypothetical protein
LFVDLVSKENDLDSNASSIDTDMDDNLSQDTSENYHRLSLATPVADPVLIVRSTVDDDLHNVSLTEHDDYLSANLSHIHLLQSNDHRHPSTMELHHERSEPILDYFVDTSSERSKANKSKPITTLSTTDTSGASNYDMTFLCDLITPPTNTILQSPVSRTSADPFFHGHWRN